MTLPWLIASVQAELASMTPVKGVQILASTAGILLAFCTVGLYIARKLLGFAIRTIRNLMPMMVGIAALTLITAAATAVRWFA